jgi:predicted nucleic acid-binding protein
LTANGYTRACTEFESLHAELVVVSVDQDLAHRAGALAERFALRAYDAAHLACALSLATETTLVSWDEDLRTAAAHSGCTLAPPS